MRRIINVHCQRWKSKPSPTQDEDNIFLTFENMIGKFPIVHINWLEYESLMQAIPVNWKLIINVPDNSTYLHKCDQLTGLKKTSKLIYTRLISKEDNLYCRNMCWEWELNVNIELVNLHKHSQNLYKVTNNTKLRNFQYKLLTRTLVTNKHLKQWKIKEEENCTWCLQDTLVELLTLRYNHLSEVTSRK